jgi:hypothetical protein
VAAVVKDILHYMKGHPHVWFARHDELARWVVENGIEEVAYVDRFPL